MRKGPIQSSQCDRLGDGGLAEPGPFYSQSRWPIRLQCRRAGMGCFLDADVLAQTFQKGTRYHCATRSLLRLKSRASAPGPPSRSIPRASRMWLHFLPAGATELMHRIGASIPQAESVASLPISQFLVQLLEGRASIRICDVVGKTIEHPDLSAIGVEVRIVPQGKPYPFHVPMTRHLRVELGGKPARVSLVNVFNVGKLYGPKQNSYTDGCTKGALDFNFDEPLDINAEIRLEFGLGVKALEVVE